MVSRRTLLRAGVAATAVGLLPGCENEAPVVASDGEEVRAAEALRPQGAVRRITLNPTVGAVDLGGPTVTTWTYGGALPGAPVRIRAGEVLDATVHNGLSVDSSVHWHGLALRNDADGVPGLTQVPIEPGGTASYRFAVTHPGTYWLHPHVGTQLDRGLYAPLIVEDPREPLAYDDEWVVILDDWLDGVDGTPDDALAKLRATGGMPHGGMMAGGSASLGGDLRYPHYLINGRVPGAPVTLTGRPGARVRIRVVNAGSDTAFRLALGGHRLQVTHADGFGVLPVEADAVQIGMGERYDALVTLGDGAFPLVALAEGKSAAAFAVVRTGTGAAPSAGVRPRELDGRIMGYRQLRPTDEVRLGDRRPDRTLTLRLTGGMMAYDWGFNGRRHDPAHFEPVRQGERVRLELINTTMMWHPVHLHGHTFALDSTGARKDTVIVLPGQTVPVTFDADNPGRWMLHCHNAYHAEAGMMTQLGYLR